MPLGHADTGACPADRPPAVGAGDQPRRDGSTCAQAQKRLFIVVNDAGDACLDDGRQGLLRAGVERRDERGVGDVVAERVKPNLARLERDVGRAQRALRSVDDADGLERRRLVRKPLPDVKRLQQIDGACEERGGPRLDRARATARAPDRSRRYRPPHARAQARRQAPKGRFRPRRRRAICRSRRYSLPPCSRFGDPSQLCGQVPSSIRKT